MKKLLPILIGLSLSGFSSLSQAENLMQVYPVSLYTSDAADD